MSYHRLHLSVPTLALAATLAACEGGGSGSSSTDINATGAISGFGSVVVADLRYDTRNARIVTADDGSLLIANPTDAQVRQYLGLGQVVRVRARSSDSGDSARTISVDSELVGPIDSIDPDNLILVVNSQNVAVTPDTIIDDSIVEAAGGVVADDVRFGNLTQTLADLFEVDMVVEISGFPTDSGLQATRIEDVNNRDRIVGDDRFNDGEAEVKGFVENLTDTQFRIGNLTVLYEPSDLDAEDFGSGGLREDQFVEVKGNRLRSGELDAIRIELEDDLFDDDFSQGRIEIEGVIQRLIPDASGPGGLIVIDGFEIRVPDISLFRVGLRVEIKGTLRADGSIVLSRVQDESEDTVRTEDVITAGDGAMFTTRLGLMVNVSDRTRVEIEGAGVGFAGQRIEARGFPLNNNILWTRVEVEPDDDQDCRLRGPVANITGTAQAFTFDILTVTIDVSQVSENNFEGANDQPIGRAAFFGELNEGDIVQATADGPGCADGTLTAREVEFENGDDGEVDDGNDNELVGTVSNVTANSFVLGGRTVTVNAGTLIDDSMIERVCGCEIANDMRFGDLTETLPQLLGATPVVEVHLSGDVALRIEDL